VIKVYNALQTDKTSHIFKLFSNFSVKKCPESAHDFPETFLDCIIIVHYMSREIAQDFVRFFSGYIMMKDRTCFDLASYANIIFVEEIS